MYEKYINEINKNNGIITSKEAQKRGISRTNLKKMTDNNLLNRIEYGIYVTDKFIYDEFYICGNHFTVEDYGNHYAVYHEEMIVGELRSLNRADATTIAVEYCKCCSR